MSARIVFIHEIPHVMGGSSSSMLDLARRLSPDAEVLAIVPDTAEMRAAVVAAGASCHPIERSLWDVGFARPFTSLLRLLRLQFRIRGALRPGDILVVNGILGEFVAGWGWLLSGHRRVYFVRGAVGKSPLWRLMSLRGLCTVVAVSSFVRDQFLAQFPRFGGRVVVIPNAIVVPPDSPSPPPDRPFRIGCVGFIHPLKNQALAIEALAALRRDGVDARLEIFGEVAGEADMAYRRQLDDAILRLGLSGHVTFHGFRPREEIYGSIHVLVSPSLSEGFGKTIAEGMAHGLPSLALAEAGGPCDIILNADEGVLLPRADAALLAKELRRLAQSGDLRRRMGAAGRLAVATRLSPGLLLSRVRGEFQRASHP